jgi:predicted lipoprotein with Yx(FWY)xxD motif
MLSAVLPLGALSWVFFSACVADEAGIANSETAGSSATAGKSGNAGSGAQPVAGSPSESGGGSGAEVTEAGSSPDAQGGTAGADAAVEMGGAGMAAPEGGQAGTLGEAGAGTTPIAMACAFHTDAVGDTGAGGAPAAPTVVLQTNAFVGSYLTDAAGRTLYTYGGDLPGDCQTPPVSQCVTDCAVSWPPFDAGARVLGAGLDDAAFGSIDRGDGTWQATYYGWPLYYYKSDLALGQLTGQGKGKTWHAAELTPPSVVILKVGTAKYLADAAGHTLYVSAADQVGTTDADPVSACDQACLSTFTPFREKSLSVVTSLEESDFSVFVRHGAGGLQLAYKGMPLYRANTDLKSGDTTGLASAGFTAAVP